MKNIVTILFASIFLMSTANAGGMIGIKAGVGDLDGTRTSSVDEKGGASSASVDSEYGAIFAEVNLADNIAVGLEIVPMEGVIDTKSIITSADYDEINNLLVMTSTVNFSDYYLIRIKDFKLNKSFSIETYPIPVGKSQIEAIKILDSTTFWITSEDEGSVDASRLFKFYLQKLN